MRLPALLALALGAAGCSGNVLYAERFTAAEVEPAAEQWRAIGAELNIVYGEAPRAGDRIRYVRTGTLPAEFRNTDPCERTPVGGLVVWDGSFETRDIAIDIDCIESGRDTLTGVLAHAFGHYLGLHHLPDGEEGVMSGIRVDFEPVEQLSCADKRMWSAHSGEPIHCEPPPQVAKGQ